MIWNCNGCSNDIYCECFINIEAMKLINAKHLKYHLIRIISNKLNEKERKIESRTTVASNAVFPIPQIDAKPKQTET